MKELAMKDLTANGLMEKHQALLDGALQAIVERRHWSPFSEVPRHYGEAAPVEGRAAFEALLGKPFEIDSVPFEGARAGAEVSPYGQALGITYSRLAADELVARASRAADSWMLASTATRTGIALEILVRLNAASFLMAHAVEHTTGQAFPMAFQAGGPHAQERGLEAVAYAWQELARIPTGSVEWEKPAGRTTIRLEKDFHIVPRGVGLVIGCATFPTWNSYPALFADLVTGNAVVVKPHPEVILPLALTVRIGREVLREQGFDPDILQLAVDTAADPVAQVLARHPAIGLVDFTGSSVFGGWLRDNVHGKPLFTEETGVNTIVIHSTDAFREMTRNLAFSLSLYSGQMCTTPQSIFVPRDGIDTDEGHKSFDEVASGIAQAIDDLLSDPARAAAVAGAIQNPATLERVASAQSLGRRSLGRIVRDSAPLTDAPASARTATPLLLAVDARDSAADDAPYAREFFGPVSFIIATDNADEAVGLATATAREQGGITAALYSRDEALIARAIPLYARAGVPLSLNLTGGIYVNQSAAFSDFHVTGGNPAGNACLTDAAFVAPRFRVVCVRKPAAA